MEKWYFDVNIHHSVDPDISAGVYGKAGFFTFRKTVVARYGATLVSWGLLNSFSLHVETLHVSEKDVVRALLGEDLGNGAGPGGTRPTCVAGIVIQNGAPGDFFGEIFIPKADESPQYNVGLGVSQSQLSKTITLGTNPEGGRGEIVASGTVDFVTR